MKIRPVSDLHLEIHALDNFESAGEDLLILAGDIGVHTLGLEVGKQIARNFNIPVLMVAGNHEFYRSRYMENPTHTWEGTPGDLRVAADRQNSAAPGELTFLEDATVTYGGVRFIGATLWTDMEYLGKGNALAEWASERNIADYHVIRKENGKRITIADPIARHKQSLAYIRSELEKEFDGPSVVITHHCPSDLSVAECYKNDPCTPVFTSRLEDFILDLKPTLWIHGHTHFPFDYTLGETRVVCNPRGYPRENFGFQQNLIVEV